MHLDAERPVQFAQKRIVGEPAVTDHQRRQIEKSRHDMQKPRGDAVLCSAPVHILPELSCSGSRHPQLECHVFGGVADDLCAGRLGVEGDADSVVLRWESVVDPGGYLVEEVFEDAELGGLEGAF